MSFPSPVVQKKNIWLFFGCSTLVNGLLAFSNLPMAWKGTALLLGLVLPAGLLWLKGPASQREKFLFWEEFFPFPPRWILCLFLLAAAFFRYIQLTTLSLWPLTDEAKSGYYSLQLAAHGSAQLLYDFSQLPPLYIWLQGLFFKAFGVSLFSLWCFPALLSLLTVVTAYLAARTHFSKSFALIFAGLIAFSFWPLYVGRFSHQGSLLLLWEFLVIWGVGKLAKASRFQRQDAKTPRTNYFEPEKQTKFENSEPPQKYAFYLGLLAGAGFYTFTSWPTVALVLSFWVFLHYRKATLMFLLGMILVYVPLGIAWLQHSYGGYIQHVWALNPAEPWGPQILRGFSDFSALFWKSVIPPNLFAYRPFWGGYLNPLLGTCFFLGTIVFLRQNPFRSAWFWILAFSLFYLPGFLTGGVEMFRILPLLPLLLAGTALGLTVLLASLKPSLRGPFLALFLLLSLGLDSYHLFGAYHGIWTHPKDNWFASKSLERLRAYQILEDWQKRTGPGYVLSELVPDLYDQSLSLAAYEFNSEQNSGINPSQAKWAALLINVHYQPYLAREFPEGEWVRLAPDVDRPEGGLMLAILPLPSSHPESLARLIRADRASHELVPLVYDNRDYGPREPVIRELFSLYPLFKGDRFLESCFWEKIAENEYGDRNYAAQVAALKTALEKGYPAAHLYNDLGALYLRRSRFTEARQVFQEALKCPLNVTSAAAGLELLNKTEKTGKLPKD